MHNLNGDSIKGVFYLEYSKSQNAFHRSTPEELFKNNIERILRNSNSDYLVIGVFNTLEECSRFSEIFINAADPKPKSKKSGLPGDVTIK